MLTVTVYILGSFILGGISWALRWGPQSQVLVLLMGLAIFPLQRFIHKVPIKELGFRRCSLRQLTVAIILPAGILAAVAFCDIQLGVARIRPLGEISNSFTASPLRGSWDLAGFLLLNAAILFLLEFVTEELMFRGYMLGKLVTLGEFKGLAIASALFGLWHLPIAIWGIGLDPVRTPLYLVNMMLLGTVLGVLFLESRSLIPVAAFHAIWNSVEYNLFGFMDQQALFVGSSRVLFDAEEGYAGTIVLMAVAAWMLVMRYRTHSVEAGQDIEETVAVEN